MNGSPFISVKTTWIAIMWK